MPRESGIADPRCRRYAWALGVLSALFALRVVGQAVQSWSPIGALPEAGAFQGSGMPYWLLLTVQVFILALMVTITRDVATATRRRNRGAARVLGWLGALYMAASIGRIVAGFALANPPPWFTAWIPAFFHVILAAFVLVLAAYHTTARRGAGQVEST